MKQIEIDVVVVGAGPGGYAAAFYAADKGKNVIIVERDEKLGGVCLNRGCIPSKALLHATHLMREASEAKAIGIEFGKAKLKLDKLRAWKDSIIDKFSAGIVGLAKSRGVEVIYGRGYFEGDSLLRVETKQGQKFIKYTKAIVAVGSRPAIPAAFDLGSKRIMTSTEALELEDVPERLLIVGGGYIGMELGTVYTTLGSEVVVVEALNTLLTGADPDLVLPVKKFAQRHFKEVRTNTKVLQMATKKKQIEVTMESKGKKVVELYDRILVSVGRTPNTGNLGLENTDAEMDEKGFIKVNSQQQTTDSGIAAIGDVVGGLMLAHKASKEARIAVDAMLGESAEFCDIVIPAVVFTDPEIAWCGLTETEAKEKGIKVNVSRFSWAASGRAMTLNRPEGMTKLILEPETDRVLGVGISGLGAGDLISEGVLAIEMGANARDIAESVHPHPTLSETFMESAENFYGYATHTITRRKTPVEV